MTDRPYTDDDLLTEAAVYREALSIPPTGDDIVRAMAGAYVESHRTGADGPTWEEVLTDPEELAEAAHRVYGLITGAADCSAWAVKLGADGLEPTDHLLNISAGPKPIARIHFAFDPDLPEEARRGLVEGLGQAIADGL